MVADHIFGQEIVLKYYVPQVYIPKLCRKIICLMGFHKQGLTSQVFPVWCKVDLYNVGTTKLTCQ